MKALTIKQPWASLIVRGGKDIENRDWGTSMRGIIAIHSSAKLEEREMFSACCFMEGFIPNFSSQFFREDTFPVGLILGTVEIVGCVKASDSPWFCGEFGFVLKNAVAFRTPIPCKGKLGFWNVPEELLPGMREQYRAAK